jgi:hypothetical protein
MRIPRSDSLDERGFYERGFGRRLQSLQGSLRSPIGTDFFWKAVSLITSLYAEKARFGPKAATGPVKNSSIGIDAAGNLKST